MAQYHTFDESRIQSTLDAARQRYRHVDVQAISATSSISADNGDLSLLAECISVTVEDHEVCLNLPLGFGSVCLPIPSFIPEGEAAQACLSICTTWGVPTGVKVSVSVAGITVVSQTFGKC